MTELHSGLDGCKHGESAYANISGAEKRSASGTTSGMSSSVAARWQLHESHAKSGNGARPVIRIQPAESVTDNCSDSNGLEIESGGCDPVSVV